MESIKMTDIFYLAVYSYIAYLGLKMSGNDKPEYALGIGLLVFYFVHMRNTRERFEEMTQPTQTIQSTEQIAPTIAMTNENQNSEKIAEINRKVNSAFDEENSPLLNTDKGLSYVGQFDASNNLDVVSRLVASKDIRFSLNCASNFSNGSQGFMCLNDDLMNTFVTRGGNRGISPISGEL
jgi:hypothetical protein